MNGCSLLLCGTELEITKMQHLCKSRLECESSYLAISVQVLVWQDLSTSQNNPPLLLRVSISRIPIQLQGLSCGLWKKCVNARNCIKITHATED